jgi:hypothetical protein
MSRLSVPLLLLASCASALVQADQFSWQLSGGTLQSSYGNYRDTDRSSIDATYYFDPVDDTRSPYALAPFLDPATQIGASVGRDRQTVPIAVSVFAPNDPSEFVMTTHDYTVAGRYVLPASRWYAGGRYTKSDIDPPSPSTNEKTDANAYGVVAGKYLGPNTTLDLTANRSSQTLHQSLRLCLLFGGCVNQPFETKNTSGELGLGFEHVRRLEKLPYSLSGRVLQTSARSETRFFPVSLPPSGSIGVPVGGIFVGVNPKATPFALGITLPRYWTYSFAGEVFPTRKLGVRLGYTYVDHDIGPEATYDVAATWFFRRNVGMQVVWSHAETRYPNLRVDEDGYAVRFVGRL